MHDSSSEDRLLRVAILLMDGVVDSTACLTTDAFAHGATLARRLDIRPRFAVVRVGLHGRTRTASGNVLPTDSTLPAVADVAVVPALAWRTPREALDLLGRVDVRNACAWLERCHRTGGVVAAGGASTLLLAQAGLLVNRHCTSDPNLTDTLRHLCPTAIVDETTPVTDADRVLCASSRLAHVDLAFAILAQLAPPALVAALADVIGAFDRRGARPLVVNIRGGAHPDAVRAEVWVRRHISMPFSMTDVARGVGLSYRTLSRRILEATGTSLQQLVHRVRFEQAWQLLQETDLAIAEIAKEVGHQDATQLRRLFRRYTGSTPSRHRADP